MEILENRKALPQHLSPPSPPPTYTTHTQTHTHTHLVAPLVWTAAPEPDLILAEVAGNVRNDLPHADALACVWWGRYL